MDRCDHKHLIVLPESTPRLRCRRCHLTIKPEELADGCCPECLEKTGRCHDDFETVETQAHSVTRYRCEQCGAMMNPSSKDR